jgi:hypothetical protein
MNLSLYGRALWNSKWIVACGLVLAVVLTFLSFAKLSWKHGTWSSPTVSYRKSEVWQNGATLLITQQGFPEGRTIFPSSAKVPFVDPGRLSYLAYLYAQLATSDPVKRLIANGHKLPGSITATPYTDATGATQPLIELSATGSSAVAATRLTDQATNAFLRYLQSQQSEAAIPDSDRAIVSVIRHPEAPFLVTPRKKTLPITVFLAVLAVTFVLALTRENRSRSRAAANEPSPLADGAVDPVVAERGSTTRPHVAVEEREARAERSPTVWRQL